MISSFRTAKCNKHFRCIQAICFLTLVTWLPCIKVSSFAVEPHRGASRFFLDSADEEEWAKLLGTGMFHGVTTNPLVLKNVKQPCTVENLNRMARKALGTVNEFVCQTWGATMDEMYENGMALTQPARDRIVVKVPVTFTGIQVARRLIQSGCRVCLTAVFDHQQAITAVAIGAEYLAPCVGIMNDIGKDGLQECQKMLDIIHGLQGKTRVMVACVRDVQVMSQLASGAAAKSHSSPTAATAAAAAGMSRMNTASFSPAIARELFVQPETKLAAAEFEQHATLARHLSPSFLAKLKTASPCWTTPTTSPIPIEETIDHPSSSPPPSSITSTKKKKWTTRTFSSSRPSTEQPRPRQTICARLCMVGKKCNKHQEQRHTVSLL